MQRLLNPHWLELYLTPDALGWAVLSGWWRPQVQDQGRIEFAGAGWQAGLAAALAQLPREPVRHLTLSDALVRYAVVPWPAGVANRKELRQYAEHAFQELHGLAPEALQLQLRAVDYLQPLFLCGVPLALLAELRQIFQAAGRRLPRVTPLFGGVFDRARQLMRGDGMLLLREPQTLTFGVLRQRRWQLINSLPLLHADPGLLAARIRQAAAAHGLDPAQPVHVLSLQRGLRSALAKHGCACIDLNDALVPQPGIAACGALEGSHARA